MCLLVASSSKSMSRGGSSLHSRCTQRRWPSESAFTCERSSACAPRTSTSSATRSGATPTAAEATSVFTGKLVPGTHSIHSLVTSAMRLTSVVHSKASSPSTSAEPPTGRRFPARMFSRLDLPAPLDPTSTTLAPRRMRRLISLHTRVVP